MSEHFHQGQTWDCNSVDERLKAIESRLQAYREALEKIANDKEFGYRSDGSKIRDCWYVEIAKKALEEKA